MGVEYGLYAPGTKTYLWLGKRVQGFTFQRSPHTVAQFLAEHCHLRDLILANDGGDMPHENGDWTELWPYDWPGTLHADSDLEDDSDLL